MIYQLGALKKEFHHIANRDAEPVVYEPTMVILNERLKGRSFHIPQDALWKYIEPADNENAAEADKADFAEMLKAIDERRVNVKARMRLTPLSNALEWDKILLEQWQIQISIKAVTFAMQAARRSKMLLCLVFNLSLCLQIFEIAVSGESMAQLLMFIQDGLDELKNMAPAEEEKGEVVGEVTLYDGGTKIGSAPVTVTETQILTEHSETEGEA